MQVNAWSIEKIYSDTYKEAPNSPFKRIRSLAKNYFENILFPGMTVDDIYSKYRRRFLE